MEKIRFEISGIKPNKTYGRWGYKDIHAITQERFSFDLYDLIVDIERDFPDFIERWEDILSDSISDRIDDLYPPDEKIQRYNTPGHIIYMFDCDLYNGDEIMTRYYLLSSWTGQKTIKDVLAGMYKIWLREKRLTDLGI